jgi:subtilisin family serine protease
LTSTPTHRAPDRRRLLAAAGLTLAALFLATGGQSAEQPAVLDSGAAAWRGFVDGERTAVSVGQRAIVVLRYASLAERVRRAGGHATEARMRTWTAAALAGQKQIAARLSREGVQIVPDFVYTRTLNGFAAVLDSRALALLERDRDVVGVYPVRVAYPATDTATLLGSDDFELSAGRRAVPRIPGFDGTGVTIALLDTGIDPTHPYLRGRLVEGIDVLDAEAAPPASTAPRQARRSSRSGLRAGSRAPKAASRSTGGRISCSRGSSVRSTPTATAARSTARAWRSWGSQSRSPRSPTALSHVPQPAPLASTRSSSRRRATTASPAPATAASPAPAVRPPRSRSAPWTHASGRRLPASWCGPVCACCWTRSCRWPVPWRPSEP